MIWSADRPNWACLHHWRRAEHDVQYIVPGPQLYPVGWQCNHVNEHMQVLSSSIHHIIPLLLHQSLHE